MSDLSYIDRNIERVRRDIEAAAYSAGRSPGEIRLLAAIKYTTPEQVARLKDCGITLVGENRVQQLLDHEKAPGLEGFEVHFIGKLQCNKAKYTVGRVSLVESLDSLRLAEELDRCSERAGKITNVLCEINSGREENKSGVLPEEAAEFCASLAGFRSLRLRGFMTMAPICEKKADYRKYFEETYRTALDIWEKTLHNIGKPLLSMGMSDSFAEAIAEGADIVRVGRALFAEE